MCCSLGHECGCSGKAVSLDYNCRVCSDLLVGRADRLLGLCSPCFHSVAQVRSVVSEMGELNAEV